MTIDQLLAVDGSGGEHETARAVVASRYSGDSAACGPARPKGAPGATPPGALEPGPQPTTPTKRPTAAVLAQELRSWLRQYPGRRPRPPLPGNPRIIGHVGEIYAYLRELREAVEEVMLLMTRRLNAALGDVDVDESENVDSDPRGYRSSTEKLNELIEQCLAHPPAVSHAATQTWIADRVL